MNSRLSLTEDNLRQAQSELENVESKSAVKNEITKMTDIVPSIPTTDIAPSTTFNVSDRRKKGYHITNMHIEKKLTYIFSIESRHIFP